MTGVVKAFRCPSGIGPPEELAVHLDPAVRIRHRQDGSAVRLEHAPDLAEQRERRREMLEQLQAHDAVVGAAVDRQQSRRIAQANVEPELGRLADVLLVELETGVLDAEAQLARARRPRPPHLAPMSSRRWPGASCAARRAPCGSAARPRDRLAALRQPEARRRPSAALPGSTCSSLTLLEPDTGEADSMLVGCGRLRLDDRSAEALAARCPTSRTTRASSRSAARR